MGINANGEFWYSSISCFLLPHRKLCPWRQYWPLGIERMANQNLVKGSIFLLQTVVGILGNFSLHYHYLFLHFTECRLRSADLIHKHLTVATPWSFYLKESLKQWRLLGWKITLVILDANLFSMFTVSAGMCLLAPSASWALTTSGL